MKETYATVNKMMEMCMDSWCMHVDYRTQISDMLSISQMNRCAA